MELMRAVSTEGGEIGTRQGADARMRVAEQSYPDIRRGYMGSQQGQLEEMEFLGGPRQSMPKQYLADDYEGRQHFERDFWPSGAPQPPLGPDGRIPLEYIEQARDVHDLRRQPMTR